MKNCIDGIKKISLVSIAFAMLLVGWKIQTAYSITNRWNDTSSECTSNGFKWIKKSQKNTFNIKSRYVRPQIITMHGDADVYVYYDSDNKFTCKSITTNAIESCIGRLSRAS